MIVLELTLQTPNRCIMVDTDSGSHSPWWVERLLSISTEECDHHRPGRQALEIDWFSRVLGRDLLVGNLSRSLGGKPNTGPISCLVVLLTQFPETIVQAYSSIADMFPDDDAIRQAEEAQVVFFASVPYHRFKIFKSKAFFLKLPFAIRVERDKPNEVTSGKVVLRCTTFG